MQVVLIIVSILLIAIVLLQSGKSDDAGAIFSGSTSDLFKNRKERGSELVISRTTLVLGLLFVIICTVISFI